MAIIPAGATLVDRLLEDISTRNAENGKNTGAELLWLRTRLDDRRRERQRTATVSSVTSTKRQRHGTLLEKIMTTSELPCERDSKNTTQGLRIPQNMNVLQLRRFLRTLGQPTLGLKPMLVTRVEAAVSSGMLLSYIEGVKSKSGEVKECARDRQRVAETVAIAQALLSPEHEPEASGTKGKGQQLDGPELPGPEVAVTKMFSAPELLNLAANKPPLQENSPPISKTARLKIDLEARLGKQKMFKRSNTMPEKSSSVKAAAAAAAPTTPSSRRPQATFGASVSPAPSLARARCMTDTRPNGRIADKSSKFCRTSSSSRGTPGVLSSKVSMATLDSSVLISPKSIPRALGFNAVEGGQGSRNGCSNEKDTKTPSSMRDLGSPSPHRLPIAKTLPRKESNPRANPSIESRPRSPLRTAAYRALDRVAKPEADASSSSPATGCATQSAFAKFRALDAAGKAPPAIRYKTKNPLKNKDAGDSGVAKSKAEAIPPRANLVRQVSKELNHTHYPKGTANHSIPNEETPSEKAAPMKKAEESPKSVGANVTAPRVSGAAHQARMPIPCTPPRPPTKVPRDSPRPGSQARVPPLPATPRPRLQSRRPASPSSSPSTASSSSASMTSPARVAAALVSAVASASRGVSILNNSAHKAALEKKKLEIAKRLQTSPARVRPLTATLTPTTPLGPPPPPSPSSSASLNVSEVASPSSAPVAVPYPIPTATPFQVLALSQPLASAKPESPVQAPGPQLGTLPPLVPIAGGGPKEERESYDDYEVEDGSSSESGGEEDEPQQIAQPPGSTDKSKIPAWARGKALGRILDKQFRRRNPVNPDKIFPEFFTCDLEHIFNAKKKKWDRTSSGNWHADRLTVAEKLAYQRAMGWA